MEQEGKDLVKDIAEMNGTPVSIDSLRKAIADNGYHYKYLHDDSTMSDLFESFLSGGLGTDLNDFVNELPVHDDNYVYVGPERAATLLNNKNAHKQYNALSEFLDNAPDEESMWSVYSSMGNNPGMRTGDPALLITDSFFADPDAYDFYTGSSDDVENEMTANDDYFDTAVAQEVDKAVKSRNMPSIDNTIHDADAKGRVSAVLKNNLDVDSAVNPYEQVALNAVTSNNSPSTFKNIVKALSGLL